MSTRPARRARVTTGSPSTSTTVSRCTRIEPASAAPFFLIAAATARWPVARALGSAQHQREEPYRPSYPESNPGLCPSSSTARSLEKRSRAYAWRAPAVKTASTSAPTSALELQGMRGAELRSLPVALSEGVREPHHAVRVGAVAEPVRVAEL